MALITCSECGKTYSDKADACPSCGCPTSLQSHSDKQSPQENSIEINTSNYSDLVNEKRKSDSYINDKLKIGGIIAVAAGAMIVLSSGLITGSEEESYRFGNTWQTDISRTDGEQFAANGFIAVGVVSILGGAFSLARAYIFSTGSESTQGVKRTKKSQITRKSIGKDRLYIELLNIAYQNLNFSGGTCQSKSELNGDIFKIKTHSGETICTFKKEEDQEDKEWDTWTICDPSES